MRDGRLIPLERLDAAANMAADQSMLESVDAGGPPTLRFYRWQRPTLSLGYFQRLSDRDHHAESRDATCVRRGSGGGAIVHHHELTYSLAWPIDPSTRGANLILYRQVRDAIVGALASLGVDAVPHSETGAPAVKLSDQSNLSDQSDPKPAEAFLCFQRRTDDDLIVAGYKVLGSAQRKGKRAVLQHGSLLLAASPLAPQLPGLRELGLVQVNGDAVESDAASVRVAELIADSASAALGIRWNLGGWAAQECLRRQHWVAHRFGESSWLNRR